MRHLYIALLFLPLTNLWAMDTAACRGYIYEPLNYQVKLTDSNADFYGLNLTFSEMHAREEDILQINLSFAINKHIMSRLVEASCRKDAQPKSETNELKILATSTLATYYQKVLDLLDVFNEVAPITDRVAIERYSENLRDEKLTKDLPPVEYRIFIKGNAVAFAYLLRYFHSKNIILEADIAQIQRILNHQKLLDQALICKAINIPTSHKKSKKMTGCAIF